MPPAVEHFALTPPVPPDAPPPATAAAPPPPAAPLPPVPPVTPTSVSVTLELPLIATATLGAPIAGDAATALPTIDNPCKVDPVTPSAMIAGTPPGGALTMEKFVSAAVPARQPP